MPGWSFPEDDQLGILVEFEVSFLCVLFQSFPLFLGSEVGSCCHDHE